MFAEADFLGYPVPDASFDFACANTSLHHMNFEAALAAMARALRPGGRLAVVGVAVAGSIGDHLAGAASVAADRLLYRPAYRKYRKRGPGAPVMDPEMTWAEIRAAAGTCCPACAAAATCCPATRCVGRSRKFSPTSAGVPLVMRVSSA